MIIARKQANLTKGRGGGGGGGKMGETTKGDGGT
jgi:hypothetical protein